MYEYTYLCQILLKCYILTYLQLYYQNSAVKQYLLHIPEITKPNRKEVIILSNQSEAFKIPCLMLPGTTTDSS